MKKILTIMALLVAFVTTGFAEKTIYLDAKKWNGDNAKFAVYTWGGTEGWVPFEAVEGETDIYKAAIDDATTGMILGRFNPSATSYGWGDELWNRAGDVTEGIADGNLFTITEAGNNHWSYSTPTLPTKVLVAGNADITKDYQEWVSDETSSNTMTKSYDFTYTLTIEGRVLKAGTYEYKIVEDANWYPQTTDNAKLVIDEDGVYTIKYTFGSLSNTVNATATKTADAEISYKYFVQEYASGAYTSLGEMTTVTEGTDANKFAALTINRTITEATTLKYKYQKVMYNGTTIVRDQWIGSDVAGDDNMWNLTEEITAPATYNITFNLWFENNSNWIDVQEQITGFYLVGDLTGGKPESETDQSKDVEMTAVAGFDGLYTYEVESFAATANTAYQYRLRANKKWGLFDLPANEYNSWTPTEDGNYSLVFKANVTGEEIDGIAAWTLTVEATKIVEPAEITSVKVVVPGAPIDPFDITNKKEEVDGKYVYSIDMDLSVVLDDIPFNFTINGETLPVSADMLDPSENNLLETISFPISSYLLKNVGSGYAVYTATATWTPNPDATSQWKLLVVGKDQRPEATTYSILYNTTGNAADWKVGDTMTESDGEFTATIKNKPGMLFAIAPTGSVGVMGIQWGQIIRPVTDGNNWEIDFADYNGTTELNANGKVWAIDEANNADVIINFTPGETGTFTITNELEFTIGQYGYSTYSNSRKYKVANATANFVTVSGSEATLVAQAEGAILPAMTGAGKGSGIIISGTAGAKAIIKSANQSADAVDSSANLLAGSGDNTYEIGTQFADGDEYTAYIFTKPEGKDLGFYLLDPSQGATLAAHKAFLAVPKTGGAPQFIGFGGTTGIDATLNDNGQMINDNVIYDLSGRRVMNPTKGLYIINGKKVVVK